jgi:hypothetical protein
MGFPGVRLTPGIGFNAGTVIKLGIVTIGGAVGTGVGVDV